MVQQVADKIRVVCVVGPTASGKTRLAAELARGLHGEVVSCDSVQVFKELDIGSAKPTPDETLGIPHHMIDVVEPETPFSAADYAKRASECVSDIASRGKVPVIAGGTGLYFTSLIDPPGFSPAGADAGYRRELREKADNGADLHAMLMKADPETASRLHRNDERRIIRALEVFHMTGKPLSSFHGNPGEAPYEPIIFGLDAKDRAFLYGRIDRRVEKMMEDGLLSEVESLYKANRLGPTAGKAIGYRQLVLYLEGKCSLDEAVALIKRETRRYAKRQLTWFRRDERIRWRYIDGEPFTEIIEDFLKTGNVFTKNVK